MSVIDLAVKRRVSVAMVTLSMVLFGFIALAELKVTLLPDLSYPTLTVRTEYTGAAPAEIENLISTPVEEAVGVVKNLRKVHSVSRTGQSDVILEFAWGTQMDQASLEVRDKLEVVQLPLEAKKPVLLRFNPSTEPILRLALSTGSEGAALDEAALKALRRYADEDLKKRIEPIDGVAAVKVGGGLEDQVQVDIDQRKLAQLGLDISVVNDRLKAENVNVSGGRIEESGERYLVRTINQFATVDAMKELLVRVVNGVPVKLKDVADVHQGYKERESVIRLAGREAIELAIYKEGDANTVKVAEGVKKALEGLKKHLPTGAKLDIVDDQSVFIRSSLAEVRQAALEGGLLSILIIFFFLRDSWSTLVISLSLPVSLIATFFFMGRLGLSLNVMSLGGLALATGMVVDDSIVVLESIAKRREQGMSVLAAAVAGTREVAMAVTASTLTSVAVFFPLVFVQGVAGQLFRDQALTVTIALLISLVVSMTLIPMLASLQSKAPQAYSDEAPVEPYLGKTRVGKVGMKVSNGLGGFLFGTLPEMLMTLVFLLRRFSRATVGRVLGFVGDIVMKPYDAVAGMYHRTLPSVLDRPAPILLFSLVAFVGSLAVVPTLGLDLIPQLQQGQFEMTLKLPPGTPIEETDAMLTSITAENNKNGNIKQMFGVSGAGTRLDANPTESGENIGRLLVSQVPGSGDAGEAAAQGALRKSANARPGTDVKFSRPQLLSFATPLEIEIRGFDLDVLRKAGQEMARRLSTNPRYADVKSTVEQGYPEIRIRFDQDRAAALGLTTRQIADQVVRKVRGEVATRYSLRERKIDVLVRAAEKDRASVEDVKNLIVNPQSDKPVTLAAVAEVVATEGPSEIHRIDQERVAVVSASIAQGDLGTAVAEIERDLAAKPLTAGATVHIGGQNEELTASVNSLVFALSLAIFLVYLVMASQFESLLHPFVILFTVPLAAVGAIFTLKATGTVLSVVVFIGMILLVGIVVKNAIVLIDKVNQLREEGVDKRNALLQAAESRLRPIMMTSICTLLGFLPLALGTGEGSEIRAPMAITVIGGLAVSTLLTLLVIPIVYERLDRKSDADYVARKRKLDELAAGDAAEAASAAH